MPKVTFKKETRGNIVSEATMWRLGYGFSAIKVCEELKLGIKIGWRSDTDAVTASIFVGGKFGIIK